MRHGKRAIVIPSRQVRRKFENPKRPTNESVQQWDDRNSQLADLDMERIRATGIPVDQDQFIKHAVKSFRNNKRQSYKY